MQSVQKLGGIGALVAAGAFAVGLAMFAILLADLASAPTPVAAVEFIIDNQLMLHLGNITSAIVFGIALVPLVMAIGDRLRDAHSPLARVASVFGLIWTGVLISGGMVASIAYVTVGDFQDTDPEMASTVWVGLDAVTEGLGGGTEILGGLWVLGTSIVALRERLFARWVNHLGVVMGVAGLGTAVPAFDEVGAIFGVGLIVWLIAVGSTLLSDPGQPTSRDLTRLANTELKPTKPMERTS